MSPISKAKHAYTFKKNALNRLLDPVPAWLQDYSVSRLKLEEARKRCNVALDAFNAAHGELADVQSEDGAQELDAEEREQEFRNLEARYHNLVDSLAETVALRDRDQLQQEKQAEAEQLRQESQAETDRLQHERIKLRLITNSTRKPTR